MTFVEIFGCLVDRSWNPSWQSGRFSWRHSESVFCFQRLAELASRCGNPHVVLILTQPMLCCPTCVVSCCIQFFFLFQSLLDPVSFWFKLWRRQVLQDFGRIWFQLCRHLAAGCGAELATCYRRRSRWSILYHHVWHCHVCCVFKKRWWPDFVTTASQATGNWHLAPSALSGNLRPAVAWATDLSPDDLHVGSDLVFA